MRCRLAPALAETGVSAARACVGRWSFALAREYLRVVALLRRLQKLGLLLRGRGHGAPTLAETGVFAAWVCPVGVVRANARTYGRSCRFGGVGLRRSLTTEKNLTTDCADGHGFGWWGGSSEGDFKFNI